MEALDQFIRNNLDRIEQYEPPDGHAGRFAVKLDAREAAGRRAYRIMMMRIAAIVVFVSFLSLVFFREYQLWRESGQEASMIVSNTEVLEAERYYSEQMQRYYRQIEELPFQNNTTEKRQVLRELQEMDEQVEIMKEDLKQYPDNELIINAIMSFYQIKIELMNDIIARVQNLNQSL